LRKSIILFSNHGAINITYIVIELFLWKKETFYSLSFSKIIIGCTVCGEGEMFTTGLRLEKFGKMPFLGPLEK